MCRGLIACAGLWFLLGTAPAGSLPPADETWVQVSTPHFVLFGDAKANEVARVGLDLERLREALAQLNPETELNSPVATKIFVFRDSKSFARYSLRKPDGSPAEVRGYFLRHHDGNYVVVDGDPKADPREVIYHEYLHYVLENNFPDLPLWFNEGLASVYSTFRGGDREVLIGLPIPEHLTWLQGHGWLPLPQLFAVDTAHGDYHEGDRRGTFYAESWALVHYLLFDDASGRPAQTSKYLSLLATGADPDRAFQAAFGNSHRALETALRDYVRRSTLPFRRYEISSQVSAAAVRIQELPRAEVLVQLGDLLAHSDPRNAAEAEGHFRSALDVDPRYAPAWAALGSLRASQGRAREAQALLEQALSLEPQQGHLHYLLGASLLSGLVQEGTFVIPSDETSLATAQKARHHLSRSLQLPHPPADAYAALGMAYLFAEDEDLAPGLRALEQARRLTPARDDVALNLGVLYTKAGQLERAQTVLRPLAARGRDAAIRRAAREGLVRGQVQAANQRLEENLPDEAVALLRQAAEETDEPGLRAQLAQDIERITVTVRRGRDVARYNQAVELAGGRRFDEAVAVLDDLLRDASDAEIRSAGQDLRRQIERFTSPRQP